MQFSFSVTLSFLVISSIVVRSVPNSIEDVKKSGRISKYYISPPRAKFVYWKEHARTPNPLSAKPKRWGTLVPSHHEAPTLACRNVCRLQADRWIQTAVGLVDPSPLGATPVSEDPD